MLDKQRLNPSLATLEKIEKATGIPIKDWLKQGGGEKWLVEEGKCSLKELEWTWKK